MMESFSPARGAPGPPAADAGESEADARRRRAWECAWEAWARAGVVLQGPSWLTEAACLDMAEHMATIARLLGEVVEQHGPAGRVPEAPHIAGPPEQLHPAAVQAPPPAPVGAPVDDVMADLPGTRAKPARAPGGPEGCGPAGQAHEREAAPGPTAADARPLCFCKVPAGPRRVTRGLHVGRPIWACPIEIPDDRCDFAVTRDESKDLAQDLPAAGAGFTDADAERLAQLWLLNPLEVAIAKGTEPLRWPVPVPRLPPPIFPAPPLPPFKLQTVPEDGEQGES